MDISRSDIFAAIAKSNDYSIEVVREFSKSRQFLKLHDVLEKGIASVSKRGLKTSETKSFIWNEKLQQVYSSCLLQESLGVSIDIWKWFLRPETHPIVMNLLPTFLLHFNAGQTIPPSFKPSVIQCLFSTQNVIQQQLEQSNLKLSLDLSCALLHLKLLLLVNHSIPVGEDPYNFGGKWWEFNQLLGITADWKELLRTFLSSKEDRYLAVNLLIGKVQYIDYLLTLPELDDQHRKDLQSFRKKIVKKLLSSLGDDELILKPVVLDRICLNLKHDRMSLICDALIKKYLSDQDYNERPSDCVLNSPEFQSSLVSSILKSLHSETDRTLDNLIGILNDTSIDWISCHSTLPLGDGQEWKRIREATAIVVDTSLTHNNLDASKILSALICLQRCVLLSSLTPVNQSRCCLILVYLLITTESEDLRKKTMEMLLEIMSGFRSLWILDFLPSSILLNKLATLPENDLLVEELTGLLLFRGFKTDDQIKDLIDNIKDCNDKKCFGSKKIYCSILSRLFVIQKRPELLSSLPSLPQLIEKSSLVIMDSLRNSFNSGCKKFLKHDQNVSSLCLMMKESASTEFKEELLSMTRSLVDYIQSGSVVINKELGRLLSIYQQTMDVEETEKRKTMTSLCKRILDTDSDESRSPKKRKTGEDEGNTTLIGIESVISNCSIDSGDLFQDILHKLRGGDFSEKVLEILNVLLTKKWKELKKETFTSVLLLFLGHLRSSSLYSTQTLLLLKSCHIMQRGLTHQQMFLVIDILTVIASQSPKPFDDRTMCCDLLFNSMDCFKEVISSHETSAIVSIPVFGTLGSIFMKRVLEVTSNEFLGQKPSTELLTKSEQVAQQLDSLLTRFSMVKNFSFVAPDLLMTYVRNSIVNISHPRIKPILTTIIYRLMKSVYENKDDFERLLIRLNQAEKLLLRYLTDNYEKHYQYKGYV